MGKELPDGMPRIIPMMAYEDVGAAIDWLTNAFGFREREEARFTSDDGRITHSEMELADGVIMLANPTPEYQNPLHHAATCQTAKRWSSVPYVIDGLHVFVEAVDDHFAQARQAG